MLANELSLEYGSAFSKRNLDYYRQFYLTFNDFSIVNTRVHNLSWSHFRRLLSVAHPDGKRPFRQHLPGPGQGCMLLASVLEEADRRVRSRGEHHLRSRPDGAPT